MKLEDLAKVRSFARPAAVPEWTLGAFRRRCITYATGVEDTDTQVIWIQSNGLTADIRAPRERPPLVGRRSLADCSKGELATLAKAEGFVANTSFRDGHMHWDAFAAFQPYDKWPEPGLLGRVGASLIEWAPSGVYVEDWRMLPRCSGLSVGLTLIGETRLDGVEEPRTGGLVIAGDHAILVLGRRAAIPDGRAHELIAGATDWKAMARSVFDAEVSYAIRSDGQFQIALAVDPFANGRALFLADGFEAGEAQDELIQRPAPHEAFSLRRWKVDTLLTGQERPRATPAKPEGLAWLNAESATLLD